MKVNEILINPTDVDGTKFPNNSRYTPKRVIRNIYTDFKTDRLLYIYTTIPIY